MSRRFQPRPPLALRLDSKRWSKGGWLKLTNGAWHLWLTFLGEGVALRNESGLLCSFGGSGWGRLEWAEGDMSARGHSEALRERACERTTREAACQTLLLVC